jgi:hypothetical protein
VDTTVFVLGKRKDTTGWPRRVPCTVRLRTFSKRHRIRAATEFEGEWDEAQLLSWFSNDGDEFLTYADSLTTALLLKIDSVSQPLGECADVQRGVTPFKLTDRPAYKTSRRAFAGTVRRYIFDPGPLRYIRFDDTLAEPKPEKYFIGPRLLLRELISRQFQLQAVHVSEDLITNKSVQSILRIHGGPDLLVLLACLNSKLMSWYFLKRSNVGQRDDFPKIVLKETRTLPVPKTIPADSSAKIVQLARHMLELQRTLRDCRTDQRKNAIQRQIDATDRQIDQLVYELYGLTDEDIALIEGRARVAAAANPQ